MRRISHPFAGWDYAPTRLGAFWDISDGVALTAGDVGGKARPTVSVLIRTMGRSGLLKDALACLANQTYTNIEVIIVEDGPETLPEFLARWRERLAITYEALGKNRGRCHAGNRAMELAKGEYFVFLDEDDLLYSDHIEQLLAALLREKSKAAMSYAFELPTKYATTPQGGVVEQGALFTRFAVPFSYSTLLRSNYIPIHCLLFHRSLFEECGGFDPNVDLCEDWNLWVRYATHSRPFSTVPKTTAIYRVPSDKKVAKRRHSEMKKYHYFSQGLTESLPVTLTVGELTGIVDSARGEFLPLLEKVIAQFPALAKPTARASKLAQKGLIRLFVKQNPKQ
jgi:glycosyltransferase involved in cell wall biosynthesis